MTERNFQFFAAFLSREILCPKGEKGAKRDIESTSEARARLIRFDLIVEFEPRIRFLVKA